MPDASSPCFSVLFVSFVVNLLLELPCVSVFSILAFVSKNGS